MIAVTVFLLVTMMWFLKEREFYIVVNA